MGWAVASVSMKERQLPQRALKISMSSSTLVPGRTVRETEELNVGSEALDPMRVDIVTSGTCKYSCRYSRLRESVLSLFSLGYMMNIRLPSIFSPNPTPTHEYAGLA